MGRLFSNRPKTGASLIDRCLETGAAEPLETIWKKKNGARFVVRLRAVPSASGQIDVAAEDLTNYRELEEKLRRSERMEAVGRLASEVAATCDNLLRDVRQDGQTWLAAMTDDSPMRQQGELLLNDVTRAASFLRQLDVYRQGAIGIIRARRPRPRAAQLDAGAEARRRR